MKVVSPKNMADLESAAYADGYSETEFMEEAGSGVALAAHDYAEKHNLDRVVTLLCGKGNNAGDAFVAGISLIHLDYEVYVILATAIEAASRLCKTNYERFLNEGGHVIEEPFKFPSRGLIIDGLFGTGFHGTINEPYTSLIQKANASRLPIISIDIPSGLNGETGVAQADAIEATETVFLGLPKTGFFLNQGPRHIGKLRYVNFGLPNDYIDDLPCDFFLSSEHSLKPLLPPIKRDWHKYERGFVVGLAGSPGMPGAAILSSTSALRAGAGIVKLVHPDGMQQELNLSPPEIIRVPYQLAKAQAVIDLMNQASATFIGPGIGQSQETRELIHHMMPNLTKPCVIDADALNHFAEKPFPLPKHTLFTPHLGEMMRLLKITKKPELSLEFLTTCRKYAADHQVTLILKGAHSFILHPNAPIIVNSSGDPGMATAGSGDVLTGLLASLLAQGLSCQDAALLGVFLHGLAGEHAAEEMTSYGMAASDIIFHFPEAFRFIMI